MPIACRDISIAMSVRDNYSAETIIYTAIKLWTSSPDKFLYTWPILFHVAQRKLWIKPQDTMIRYHPAIDADISNL